MITSKAILKEYLEADRVALGIKNIFPAILIKDVLKFEISLRYYEYYVNRGGITEVIMAFD
ncbi:MAG: hypothetical protein IJ153_04210 [Clostridia bacterium]|nr:hypothetical protein [Clostridia bacterium]